jgi:hypothetical protein
MSPLVNSLPSSSLVPLYYSFRHVLNDDQHSFDAALQFLVLAFIFLALENTLAYKTALWVALIPILLINVALHIFSVVGSYMFT